MPKVSINILTKNRAELLKKALAGVGAQSFKDFELVVVDDGSTDKTAAVLLAARATVLRHPQSLGIIKSRQEALARSQGDYIAILDDDDQWVDNDKLKKQVEFLDAHPDCVIVGGGILISNPQSQISRFRPQTDAQIRRTMLLRNNFFTSTVMFRRGAAIKAGGFLSDGVDLAEDYDLWLRLGKFGKFYNFPGVFTLYRQSQYNKERFGQFLAKQKKLMSHHKKSILTIISPSRSNGCA